MRRLRDAFVSAVRADELWSPGDGVALAVSGGADSLALLGLALQTQPIHGADLMVVYVDHGQFEGSAAVGEAVRRRCEREGARVQVVRANLPPGASEDQARSARYAIFDSLPVDRVALGHHERDQAETVLIQLMRGTGARGWRGMPVRRGRFVRPLLHQRPEDLREFVDSLGWHVFEDPSNTDERFLRNRIRRRLLPLLDELRPGAVSAVARSARFALEEDRWMDAQVDALVTPAEAPTPLLRRWVHRQFHPIGTRQVEAVIACIRARRGGVDLGGARRLEVAGDEITLRAGTRGDSTG